MKSIHKYTINPHQLILVTPAKLIILLLLLCGNSSITLFTPMLARAASTNSPTFTQFPIPNIGAVGDITKGSDGNLWFIEGSESNGVPSYIIRVTPSGTMTEYTVPTPTGANFVFPTNITSGPDGDLWFDMRVPNANGSTAYDIASVTTSGTFTEYPMPSGWGMPGDITSGSDGNLWFVMNNCATASLGGSNIGRMTPNGVFTEYPMPATSCPSSITSGSDGNLWFTDSSPGAIGRITPSGSITEFPLPGTSPGASDIITGSGGDLWFFASSEETTGVYNSSIGRITPSGSITEFPLPSGESSYTGPYSIAAGSDGNIWFTYLLTNTSESSVFELYSITPDGTLTEYPFPTSSIAGFSLYAPTLYMTSGSDGNLWLTASNIGAGELTNQSVVRINIPSSTQTPAPPPPQQTPPNPPAQNPACKDILFVGARGSGEAGPGKPGWVPTSANPLGFGSTVLSAYNQLKAKIGSKYTIEPISADYPANSVFSLPLAADKYFGGLSQGENVVINYLINRTATCPNEQIVLAGYSQGAMVMHDVLHELENTNSGNEVLARLDAAILIGDGDRVPHDNVQYFGSMHQGHEGIGLAWTSQSGATTTKFPETLAGRVYEVCNRGDPVCDEPAATITTYVHFQYPGSAALSEATDSAADSVLSTPVPTPRVVNLKLNAGKPFSHQLTAKIGTDYTLEWSLMPPGVMPKGLKLSSRGLITGTPVNTPTGQTQIRVRSQILGISGNWVPVTLDWNAN